MVSERECFKNVHTCVCSMVPHVICYLDFYRSRLIRDHLCLCIYTCVCLHTLPLWNKTNNKQSMKRWIQRHEFVPGELKHFAYSCWGLEDSPHLMLDVGVQYLGELCAG